MVLNVGTAHLGEFGDPCRLRDRRLRVQPTHRTRRELHGAARCVAPRRPRRPVVGRDAHRGETDERVDRCVEEYGERVEPCGQICRALLGAAECPRDKREETAPHSAHGVQRIPGGRTNLDTLEADGSERGEGKVAICRVVAIEVRRWKRAKPKSTSAWAPSHTAIMPGVGADQLASPCTKRKAGQNARIAAHGASEAQLRECCGAFTVAWEWL